MFDPENFEDFDQNVLESDPEVKKEVEKQIHGMSAYTQKLYDRVDQMQIIHEDLIIVEKLDVRAIKSFLTFVEKSRFEQTRISYMGRVIGISSVMSDNPINEVKKSMMKRGDLVSFNPDSAYSMNIVVPEEHPELWCLAVDNILFVDAGFNPEQARKKSIEANVILDRIQKNRRAAAMRAAETDLKNKMRKDNKVLL